MRRYFVRHYVFKRYSDFWNIEISGNRVTTTSGKLGSVGESATMDFESAEACQNEADRLMAAMLKKKYSECPTISQSPIENATRRYECPFSADVGNPMQWFIDTIVGDPQLAEIRHVVIGVWPDCFAPFCEPLIKAIAENEESKRRFAHVESLFVGDISEEQVEISWIAQGDYSGLPLALPHLKSLKFKGYGARLGREFASQSLQTLEIYTGGLERDLLDDILAARLPNLRRLVVYHGVEDYSSYYPDVEHFLRLADPTRFPKLKYLGLNDSPQQDLIVDGLMHSKILDQLEVLDFSNGTLTDSGAQTLIDNAGRLVQAKNLKSIVADYHFVTDAMLARLKATLAHRIQIDFTGSQNPDGVELDKTALCRFIQSKHASRQQSLVFA